MGYKKNKEKERFQTLVSMLPIVALIIIIQSVDLGNHISDIDFDFYSLGLLAAVILVSILLYKKIEAGNNIPTKLVGIGIIMTFLNYPYYKMIGAERLFDNTIMRWGLFVCLIGVVLYFFLRKNIK